MKTIYSILVFGLSLVLISSCNESKNTGNTIEVDSTDTKNDDFNSELSQDVNSKFYQLKTELDSSWLRLLKLDEEVLFSINRTMQEVSYTSQYDKELFDKWTKYYIEIKENPFNQEIILKGADIDAYDDKMKSLITGLHEVVATCKEKDAHPIIDDLLNEISNYNNQLIQRRVDYDYKVLDMQDFLRKNESKLLKIDEEEIKSARLNAFQQTIES